MGVSFIEYQIGSGRSLRDAKGFARVCAGVGARRRVGVGRVGGRGCALRGVRRLSGEGQRGRCVRFRRRAVAARRARRIDRLTASALPHCLSALLLGSVCSVSH